MREISIRELHLRTGQWTRKTAVEGKIVITDHGRPIATLTRFHPSQQRILFTQRTFLPKFKMLQKMSGDVTASISEDRDRV